MTSTEERSIAGPQFLDDQPRFDGLADTDFIGDQQAGAVGTDKFSTGRYWYGTN